MRYAIAFDISDDRARYRAVKALNECSYRVQKSVFEGILSREACETLMAKLENIIDTDTDSVRFYPLCKDCESKVILRGVGTTVEQTSYMIV